MEYTLGMEYSLYNLHTFQIQHILKDLCLLVLSTKINMTSSTEKITTKKTNFNKKNFGDFQVYEYTKIV
jgi:hypothetical protein